MQHPDLRLAGDPLSRAFHSRRSDYGSVAEMNSRQSALRGAPEPA